MRDGISPLPEVPIAFRQDLKILKRLKEETRKSVTIQNSKAGPYVVPGWSIFTSGDLVWHFNLG